VSNSTANIYDLITNQRTDIDNIASVEYPAAGLTLTRSGTLAITTAGTTITWQTETRNYGFTWSGTTITIPTDGYYTVAVSVAIALNTTLQIRMILGAANSRVTYNAAPLSTGGGFMASANWCVYLNTGNTLQIALTPGANTTLNQNGEYNAAPSPFVHIAQLTGSIE
jgi:hypothetical protein